MSRPWARVRLKMGLTFFNSSSKTVISSLGARNFGCGYLRTRKLVPSISPGSTSSSIPCFPSKVWVEIAHKDVAKQSVCIWKLTAGLVAADSDMLSCVLTCLSATSSKMRLERPTDRDVHEWRDRVRGIWENMLPSKPLEPSALTNAGLSACALVSNILGSGYARIKHWTHQKKEYLGSADTQVDTSIVATREYFLPRLAMRAVSCRPSAPRLRWKHLAVVFRNIMAGKADEAIEDEVIEDIGIPGAKQVKFFLVL